MDGEWTERELELLREKDDLITEAQRLRRNAGEARWVLDNCLEALRDGRADLGIEFVERALGFLRK